MLIQLCAVLSLALGAAACIDETSADTQASSVGSGSGAGGHRCGPPPQEAFDACASSAAGDTCAFSIDSHDITGTCKNGPDGTGELACAPDRPPPPPEAIDACASSAAGDTCAFSIDGHDITGTCKNGPDGNGVLACAPDQPPPPPPH